jgi:cytochrome c biogenesis protein CcmG, thiol:disulfide interchange protein DsbE
VAGAAPPEPGVQADRPAPPRTGWRLPGGMVTVAGLVLVGLLAVPLLVRERPAPAGAGPTGPDPATAVRTYPPGTAAPALRLPGLDGGRVDLADLRGRPVVVNFWASWCLPCTREFPLLRQALAAHAGDRLAVVGVLVNDDPASARAFQRRAGGTWPVGVDADGRAVAAFGAVGLPQSYFVRPDGTLASRQLGELTRTSLDRQLAAIL